MVTPLDRRGFTLIELLVVIVIMAVLSGMILASINLFGFGSKREQTNAAMAALRTAIEMNRAERGGAMAPAEHPLAGSRAPRTAFLRADGSTWVATGGLALQGVPPLQVAAAKRDRVLAGDDVFADQRVPALYGLRRDHIGVVGVPQATVTAYRRLPAGITTGDDPDDATAYPDHRHNESAQGTPDETKRAMDHLFGAGNIQSELLGLGSLTGPDPGYVHDDFTDAAFDQRVVSSVPPTGGGVSEWQPGHLRDGLIPSGPEAGQPNWKPYKLRGLGIYDAWGNEILFSLSANGGLRLISAGRDGCFRWHPGGDGQLQTAADATQPSGDDTDGADDNQAQVVGD